MTKILKALSYLRIIIAILVFLSLSAHFVDTDLLLKKWWYMLNITKNTQFFASLVSFINTLIIPTTLIVIVVLSLLIGRVYCSLLCPFGILMDFLGRLNPKRKLKYKKNIPILRAFFAILAILLTAFGFTAFVGIFEPYSLFGKFASSILKSIALFFISSPDCQDGDILNRIYFTYPAIASLLIGGLIFIALLISVTKRGRLFCNTICPVGAILGAFASFSIFKISISDKCIKCGKCAVKCKSECMDIKNSKVDFSKCVMCLDCARACNNSAITLKTSYWLKRLFTKSAKQNDDNVDVSKRNSFAALFGLSSLMLSGAKKDCTYYRRNDCRNSKRFVEYATPAGSISVENFREKCTACQLCTTVCKGNVLKPSYSQLGLEYFMQPYFDYNSGYCIYTCHNCSKVCPTGAINFIGGQQKRKTAIGKAFVDIDKCIVNTEKSFCTICSDLCPTSAIQTYVANPEQEGAVPILLPMIKRKLCVGCGLCVNACIAQPKAIKIIGLAIHEAVVLSEKRESKKPQEKNSLGAK